MGGNTYGSTTLSNLNLGSGGGGGVNQYGVGPAGGNGAGAISVSAGFLGVAGQIQANGGSGGSGTGGGGGGSGGSIALQVATAYNPGQLGSPSSSIASISVTFTPSNFVAAVGQLDGVGADEIIIGADGNPVATTNFLIVLTRTSAGWSTQRVDIGQFGVTSIAVGQPKNRPSAAIYVGSAVRQTAVVALLRYHLTQQTGRQNL